MKKCLLILLVMLTAAAGSADDKLWFPIGEVLHYKLKWSFIPIGHSRIETAEVDTGGKKLIAIRYYVKTNAVFDKIYPVNDFMEVLIDPDGFVPVTFTKLIERRTPRCNETVVFNRETGEAQWYSKCLNKHGAFAIDQDTRDIITFLYLTRKENISEGTAMSNRVVITRSITDMVVKVGKKQKMDVAGRDDVEVYEVTPIARLDDILVDEGEVKAWVSADKRRIVTKLKIDAAFGSVKAFLEKVEGPGDDEWVQTGEDEEE